MTDDKRKPKSPNEPDLDGDWDEWDKMFDSLHEDEGIEVSDVGLHGAKTSAARATRPDGNFIAVEGATENLSEATSDYEGIEIAPGPVDLAEMAARPIELEDAVSGEIILDQDLAHNASAESEEPTMIASDPGSLAAGEDMDLFELGPAGGEVEPKTAIAAERFELGAAGVATEQSAKAAAAAFFGDEEPLLEDRSQAGSIDETIDADTRDAGLDLDQSDDFYDDIEIGGEAEVEQPAARHPTVNVVRRETTTQPTDADDGDAFDFVTHNEATRVAPLSSAQIAELHASTEPTVDVDQRLEGRQGIPDDVESVFAPSEDDIDNAIDDLFSFSGGEDSGDLAVDEESDSVILLEPIAAQSPRGDSAVAAASPPAEGLEALDLEGTSDDEIDFSELPEPVPVPDTALVDVEETSIIEVIPSAPTAAAASEQEVTIDAGIVLDLVDETMSAAEAATLDATLDQLATPEETAAQEPRAGSIGGTTRADLQPAPFDLGEYDDDEEMESLHTGIFVLALDDADVAPELPPSPFADDLPGLDLDQLQLAELAEPALEDRTEEDATGLLIYDRELELVDEPGPVLRLLLECARLTLRIEDYDNARAHFGRALELSPTCIEAVRGLRRVAQGLGDWPQALAHLDQELSLSSPMERRALAGYRADLLAVLGEAELAAAACDDLLHEAPSDVRALLLRLELAQAQDDVEKSAEVLDALVRSMGDESTVGSLLLARSASPAKDHEGGQRALDASLNQPDISIVAALAAAPLAEARRDWARAAAIWRRAAQGPTAGRDPELAGVLLYRAALAARRGDDSDTAWQLLALAVDQLPYDYVAHRAYAVACGQRDDYETAAISFQKLASLATGDIDRSMALVKAAELWERVAPEDLDAAKKVQDRALGCYREAAALDPSNRRAISALERLATSTGDVTASNAVDLVIDETETDESAIGSLYSRLRRAHRQLLAGDHEEASAELVSLRASGAESPLLTRLLDRALAYAGRFDERATLLRETADSEAQWLAPVVGLERAARASEDVLNYRLLAAAQGDAPQDEQRKAARDAAILEALDDAIRAWNAVVDLEASSQGALLALLSLGRRHAYRTGQIDELANSLESAASTALTPARRTQLGLRYSAILLGKDDDDSIAAAEACLTETAGAEDIRTSLARMLQSVASEDWEKTAEILIDSADAIGPTPVTDGMRFRAAYILLDRVDDAERAIDVVTPVLERHPDFHAAQDLVRSAHRHLGGTAILDTNLTAPGTGVDVRRDFGDPFAQLIREAEHLEARVGEPAAATKVYKKAMKLRPGDAIARMGFERAARAANRVSDLADLALSELKAVDPSDTAAKAYAYEQLADIDAKMRGDVDSALFSLGAAVDMEPSHLPALRALEVQHGVRRSWQELHGVYGRLISTLGNGIDATELTLERAELAQLSGQSKQVTDGLYRECYERAPRSRQALLYLEGTALQEEEPSVEMAELEVAVASYFDFDPATRAEFYTRAGEIFAALQTHEAAIEHFRLALDADDGCDAALRGLSDAAASSEQWEDLVEACNLRARATLEPEQKIAFLHLAAVTLMDRVLDGPRAKDALKRVLMIEPLHKDAFARVRLLCDEEGQHEELVALLEERAAIEEDIPARLELHYAASQLYRNLFSDRDRASHHLREMLELRPDHERAISELSDIAWEHGDWAEAAQTLIQRARLEKDPKLLRNIFFRLGLIYSDRMPDARWAIKSFERVLSFDESDLEALSRLADLYTEAEEWTKALGACERLIKNETNPSAKINHLHRAATIYKLGFQDSVRAEKALRIALDVDPSNDKALTAVIEFFEELGDAKGLRVQLDRVAAAMRSRVYSKPLDRVAYQVLTRVFSRRAELGVAGSKQASFCAAELAALVGGAGEAEREVLAAARQYKPRLGGLTAPEVDELLYPRAVSASLRELLQLLGERVARYVGIDLRKYGVGRGDRLASDHPVVHVAQEVADILKLGEVEVYVSRTQPTVAVAEPSSPIALILGESLVKADRPEQARFLAGRALQLLSGGLAVPSRMEPRAFGLLVAGLIRPFQPDFTVPGLESSAIQEEIEHQKRLVPGNMHQSLAPFAVGVAGAAFDFKKVSAAITEAGNRAGLLVCGSVTTAVQALLVMGGYPDIQSALRDPAILHLARFAVSEEYAVIRAALER